jgi:hypothetical protein
MVIQTNIETKRHDRQVHVARIAIVIAVRHAEGKFTPAYRVRVVNGE